MKSVYLILRHQSLLAFERNKNNEFVSVAVKGEAETHLAAEDHCHKFQNILECLVRYFNTRDLVFKVLFLAGQKRVYGEYLREALKGKQFAFVEFDTLLENIARKEGPRPPLVTPSDNDSRTVRVDDELYKFNYTGPDNQFVFDPWKPLNDEDKQKTYKTYDLNSLLEIVEAILPTEEVNEKRPSSRSKRSKKFEPDQPYTYGNPSDKPDKASPKNSYPGTGKIFIVEVINESGGNNLTLQKVEVKTGVSICAGRYSNNLGQPEIDFAKFITDKILLKQISRRNAEFFLKSERPVIHPIGNNPVRLVRNSQTKCLTSLEELQDGDSIYLVQGYVIRIIFRE